MTQYLRDNQIFGGNVQINGSVLGPGITQLLDGYTTSTGSTSDGYLAFFTGTNKIAGDNDLRFDRTTNTLSLNNHKLTDVAEPITPQDAATKNYVDTHASSSFDTSVLDGYVTSTTGDVIISVSAAGNDSDPARPPIIKNGDYTANPFLTIQAAIDSMPTYQPHNITINVSPGDYSEYVVMSQHYGYGTLIIQCDGTVLEPYIPSTGVSSFTWPDDETGGYGKYTIAGAGWTDGDLAGTTLIDERGYNYVWGIVVWNTATELYVANLLGYVGTHEISFTKKSLYITSLSFTGVQSAIQLSNIRADELIISKCDSLDLQYCSITSSGLGSEDTRHLGSINTVYSNSALVLVRTPDLVVAGYFGNCTITVDQCSGSITIVDSAEIYPGITKSRNFELISSGYTYNATDFIQALQSEFTATIAHVEITGTAIGLINHCTLLLPSASAGNTDYFVSVGPGSLVDVGDPTGIVCSTNYAILDDGYGVAASYLINDGDAFTTTKGSRIFRNIP